MKQIVLILLLILTSCAKKTVSYGDSSIMMSNKMTNTKWETEGFATQSIEVTANTIRLSAGRVLGSTSTPFTVVDEDSTYVLYSVYEEYLPSYLGVVQKSDNMIQLLVWQGNIIPNKIDMIDLIESKGKFYKLISKK